MTELSDDEVDRWLSGTIASGVATDGEYIDDIVYGRELDPETA
ncbi:hypothetical protein [Haloarchaeobius iranensis]|uniref:Uncharacterized protein n=1 Tax=Haloarchaeobius iranensis TaxID=996166 RepID=A0A1H0A589_9EURY|nr:hypothetical protein [Haloarchaeobius iranensis]SDN28660.1 hypothetical protein SAMN05192554_1252 [Haloarchaeobius iranensis]